ncbi:MAG: ATP-dependent metallopeptidase FtsH/Yme1/Tma family protein [Proteobacteria bacterium]|nr:ATP-dependent metallopeptidase FtsH/Yme1/Tma family protein [Pseudomonadota bacterium]
MKKNLIIWAIVLIALFALSAYLDGTNNSKNNINFSDFINKVENSEVTEVKIKGNDLNGVLKDGSTFYTYLPYYPNLIEKLYAKGVAINSLPLISKSEKITSGLLGWLPFLIMIGLWIFFAKGASGKGGGGAFGFGKSRAKLLQENKNKITFQDVAGIDEAKQELSEIVDFLKSPKKYLEVGAKIPRGCLLIGSPGTGKTLLARAIAGEAGVPFFSISGSDFVEMFVGVGASRVRDMFEQAKKSAPCIVFIDEIDAVGRHRGSGYGGGNDEREQTLNQMLVEMDGFSDNEGVVVIAATNRPDVLDKALLRPGRFDRQITVPNPDILGREQILVVHMKKINAASDINVKIIARGTPGFAGADLANLVNEGAIMAARSNQKMVTMKNLEDAKDKILMGTERKSIIMQKSEKELTAYHEAGHAITAINSPNSDPIHKATIIPRGRALGLVMRLPENDCFSVTRAKLQDDLVVAMGGRVSEEIIFGYDKITTGASSDISQATYMAKNMVTKWGLSDKLGTVDLSEDDSNKMFSNKSYSEATSQMIDQEVRRIIEEAYNKAKDILLAKNSDLHLLAKALLEYETLTGEQIKILLAGGEINKPNQEQSSMTSSLSSI